ncbi:MAG: DNA-3-methyladenine glycosylase [Lautropia sp.]
MSPAAGGSPHYWDEAIAGLAGADPVLGTLIGRWPGERLVLRGDPFLTLARAIVGQQISVKAAQTIWGRFARAAGEVAPARVARMRPATLTRAGLSQRKAEYLRDLAVHFVTGRIVPDRWPMLDDETVIAELIAVRGIGRWTAEMFLMFNLMRPDVMPLDDIGLLQAIGVHYNGGIRVSREQAREIAVRWRPWRTVAAWYLWRSLDPLPVEY